MRAPRTGKSAAQNRAVVNALFDEIDTDGEGTIDMNELHDAVKPAGTRKRRNASDITPSSELRAFGWKPHTRVLVAPLPPAPMPHQAMTPPVLN